MGHATARSRDLAARLKAVSHRGLERHAAAALCRVYAGACSQYPLRLGDASAGQTVEHDGGGPGDLGVVGWQAPD